MPYFFYSSCSYSTCCSERIVLSKVMITGEECAPRRPYLLAASLRETLQLDKSVIVGGSVFA